MFCSFMNHSSLSKVEKETFIYQILLKKFGLWPFWRCKKEIKEVSCSHPSILWCYLKPQEKCMAKILVVLCDSTETGAPNSPRNSKCK